jgi:hypothetical protein
MANTLKKLAQAQLGTGISTLYTVPGATKTVIGVVHVANTTNSDKTFRLHHVPSAGSADTTNALAYDLTVKANDFLEFGKGLVLETGETLQGLASAAGAVTVQVSGIESA